MSPLGARENMASISGSGSNNIPSSSHAQLQPITRLRADALPRSLPELVRFIDQFFPASQANLDDLTTASRKVQYWLAPAVAAVVGFEHKHLDDGPPTSPEERSLELDLLMGGWAAQGLRTKGLAVAMLICRRLSVPASNNYPVPATQILDLAQRVMRECPPEDLRWAGKGLDYLSTDLLQLARANDQLPSILPTLRALSIAKSLNSVHTVGSRGVLVPGHVPFLEGCLLSRNLEMARELLDTPMVDVSLLNFAQEALGYYYLGGTIYLGLREWEKARDFFETAVTFPGSAVSAIQVAAHKKLVLAHLILTGKTYSYPKYLSSIIQRAIKSHATLYNDVAEAFQALDENKVLDIRDKRGAEFMADQNFGLLEQVLETWYKRKLLRLTRTYKKIEISDAARLINYTNGAESLERMIRGLIERGEVHARIITDTHPSSSKARKSIEFVDPEDGFDKTSTAAKFAQLKALAAQRTRHLVRENRQLGKNPDWLKSVVQMESGSVQNVAATLLSGVPGGIPGGGGSGQSRPMRGVGSNWADMGF